MEESDAAHSFDAWRTMRMLPALGLAALLYLSGGAPTLAAPERPPAATSGTIDLAVVDPAASFGFETVAQSDTQAATAPAPEPAATADLAVAAKPRVRTVDETPSAALLGDVNGDGIGDMAIGDPDADPLGRKNAGSVYVVFGARAPQPRVNLGELGSRGYRIDGRGAGARMGASIAALGDTDADGIADFAAGAPRAAVAKTGRSGVVYVVRGAKTPAADIDLRIVNSRITPLLGAANGDLTGWAVAALPPADGRPSGVIIGAPRADPDGDGAAASADVLRGSAVRDGAGSVYVVPGPLPRGGGRRLNALAGSYRIDGAEANAHAGWAIGASPDMSGDGLDEVLLGAPQSGPDGAGGFAGAAFVVPARPIGGVVDLATPNSGSMTLRGEAGSALGTSIAGIGDVTGDGWPDVAVGAPKASPHARTRAGSVFVVRGVAGVTLPDSAEVASRLDGGRRQDGFGRRIAAAGDLDGDGVADLLVAAPRADALARQDAGAVYEVRGSDIRSGDVNVALLGNSGIRLAGAAAGDFAGSALAGGLDGDGDARPDVLAAGTSTASLLDLPTLPAQARAIPEKEAAGCVQTSDIEIVVDDSGSMRASDAQLLRRAALDQMLTKPRSAPIRLGAIEIGRDAAEVFAPLTVPATGVPEGAPLRILRGLIDEHVRNDAGPTDFAAGLLAAQRHNIDADTVVLITDATEPPPKIALPRKKGQRVYVLELRGAAAGPSTRALVELAHGTGGRYFQALDATSLTASLAVVEAAVRCEQVLRTEVVAPADDRPPPAAPLTAPQKTASVIATSGEPTDSTTFETAAPEATDAITMTLTYPAEDVHYEAGTRSSCADVSPVGLGTVEVGAPGRPRVRATARQVDRALSGRLTAIGKPGLQKLYARARCGRGYLTLRIVGLQSVSTAAPGARAAGVTSPRRARISANRRFGAPRKSTAVTTGAKRKSRKHR